MRSVVLQFSILSWPSVRSHFTPFELVILEAYATEYSKVLHLYLKLEDLYYQERPHLDLTKEEMEWLVRYESKHGSLKVKAV